MSSTLASTPTMTTSPNIEMDKEWISALNVRQAELLHHQLMDQYINLLKMDAPLSFNPRSERDWDNFFTKLEERFIIVGVLPEYRIHLTRRYLRDEYLKRWVELSAGPDAAYDTIRDGMYRTFFPNSDMWESIMRVIIGPWTDADTPLAVLSSIPTGVNETGMTTDQSSSSAQHQLQRQTSSGAEDELQQQQQAQQQSRRAFSSATSIKNRVNAERRNLNRVAVRYGKSAPAEEVWVKWALSMMASPLQDLAKAIEPQALSTVAVMLDKLVESENVSNNSRFRTRKNRNRFKKPNPSRRMSAAGSAAATARVSSQSAEHTKPQSSVVADSQQKRVLSPA